MSEAGKKYYCFIRLYQTEYKKSFYPGAILATINKAIATPGKNDKMYTHAAMNFQLNDNFVGLNMSFNNNDVQVETLRTMHTGPDKAQDRETSKFDMFYLELSKDEYNSLKKTLIKVKTDKNIKYDFLRLLVISKDIMLKKIGNLLSFSKEADVIDTSGMSLVCSTFVAWVLSKICRKCNEYFKMKDINVYSVTPNDLTYLPGVVYMYGGYWKEYATLTRKYIAEHKEFEQFI